MICSSSAALKSSTKDLPETSRPVRRYFSRRRVMVADASPAQISPTLRAADLLSQGDGAHRHLEAWFAAHRLDFVRMGYQEDVELFDAYNAQACRDKPAKARFWPL